MDAIHSISKHTSDVWMMIFTLAAVFWRALFVISKCSVQRAVLLGVNIYHSLIDLNFSYILAFVFLWVHAWVRCDALRSISVGLRPWVSYEVHVLILITFSRSLLVQVSKAFYRCVLE